MGNLREEIERIYEEAFPDEVCRKFSGALTVELIRKRLKASGIPVSPRDVFIHGLPLEIDLIIPRRNSRLVHNILYRSEDIAAVLEIKYRGSFGSDALERTRANFQRIRQFSSQIQCFYVAVIETKGYKWAVYRKNLGFPAHTLYWWSNKSKVYTESKDWNKLVLRLASLIM